MSGNAEKLFLNPLNDMLLKNWRSKERAEGRPRRGVCVKYVGKFRKFALYLANFGKKTISPRNCNHQNCISAKKMINLLFFSKPRVLQACATELTRRNTRVVFLGKARLLSTMDLTGGLKTIFAMNWGEWECREIVFESPQ